MRSIINGFAATIVLLIFFIAGFGSARAAFGWQSILAPCVPTGIALSASDIAVTCPGERTIYLRAR